MLRSRAGGSIKLVGLLDEAVARAAELARQKNPDLSEAAIAEGVLVAVAVTTGRYKTAVNATCDASGASATAALTGSFIMGQTLEESSAAGELRLIDVHPMGCRPGTLA